MENKKLVYFTDKVLYGDGYAIDEEGNVYSTKNNGIKMLKPRKHTNKGYQVYYKVAFCNNGNRRDYYIHNLYLIAFGKEYDYKTKGAKD